MGQPYWNYIEGGKRRRGSFPEESCYRSLVEVVEVWHPQREILKLTT